VSHRHQFAVNDLDVSITVERGANVSREPSDFGERLEDARAL
jgi:hypothetical protein